MNKRFDFALTIIICVGLILAVGGFRSRAEDKPLVIGTTTVVGAFVKELGGSLVRIHTIVPAGTCPAHYDLKPSDYQAVKDADLVIKHGGGAEPWLDQMIKSTGNDDVEVHRTGGPWNLPPRVEEIASGIISSLVKVDRGHRDGYQGRLEEFREKLSSLESGLREKAARAEVASLKVISMQWQAGFVQWLGFQLVDSYAPPETLSTKRYQELVEVGKDEEVNFVVDNLQSGTKLGGKIAFQIGAEHVVLTNFPIKGIHGILGMIDQNAEKLLTVADQLSSSG